MAEGFLDSTPTSSNTESFLASINDSRQDERDISAAFHKEVLSSLTRLNDR